MDDYVYNVNALQQTDKYIQQTDKYIQQLYFPICVGLVFLKGLFGIVGCLCMLVCIEFLKQVIHKERPNKVDFKSFPSGHAAVVWYIAGLYKFNTLIVLWALSVSVSRVYNKHHTILDVVCGGVIGIVFGSLIPR